jgi:predicted negative regulator of RcsB-dependent stress response
MLKPKKKITKKEIKKDPFLEALYNFRNRFLENQKLITRIVIGVVAVVVVVLILNRRASVAQENADALFGQALVSYEIGDIDNAVFQFEQLADEYDGTKTGRLGYFYLGKISYDQKSYDAAQKHLQNFTKSSSKELLLVPAYTMLGAMAVLDEDLSLAEDYYRKALKNCNTPTEQNRAKLRLADILIDNDKISEATDLVESIVNSDNVPYKLRQDAEELFGRINS